MRLIFAFCVFSILALCVLGSPPGSEACIIDPCNCSSELLAAYPPVPLFACPAGDTPSFADQGWTLQITVHGCVDEPVPGIPATDFWLIDPTFGDNINLCGGHLSSNADAPTDANGMTTMSATTLVAGGCVDGLSVVAQGFVIIDPEDCINYKVEPIHMRSPDIDGSLTVDVVDLALFATYFLPNPYAPCGDMNADGLINMVDLSMFAVHFGPPGHACQ